MACWIGVAGRLPIGVILEAGDIAEARRMATCDVQDEAAKNV